MQLSAILFLIPVIIWVVALVISFIGYFIVRCCYFSSEKLIDEEYELANSDTSFYLARAKIPCLLSCFGDLVSILTFGIGTPCVIIDKASYMSTRVLFGGKRSRFFGTAGGFCVNVQIKNAILTVLTLGLWQCCGCAKKTAMKWLDTNSHPLETQNGDQLPFYFYQADQSCLNCVFSFCGMGLSCGLLAPYLFLCKVEEIIQQMNFFGTKAVFKGECCDFCCSVVIKNLIFGIFTCGLWICCGCAEKLQNTWLDKHTFVRADEHRHHHHHHHHDQNTGKTNQYMDYTPQDNHENVYIYGVNDGSVNYSH